MSPRALTRTAAALVLAVAAVPLLVPDAHAAAGHRLAATPHTAVAGQTVTFTGTQWPVIEFCRPSVVLRGPRSIVHRVGGFIGHVPIGTNGTFKKVWTAPLNLSSGLSQ